MSMGHFFTKPFSNPMEWNATNVSRLPYFPNRAKKCIKVTYLHVTRWIICDMYLR
jgi:hypothetical protein